MNQLTVLISTSPIPSHPSTAILDETIFNIRKYTDAQIVIMADGVHESLKHRTLNYKQYLRNVEDNVDSDQYGNARLWIFPDHEHQARMVKAILPIIKTPLIMFCEHDCYPIGEIPFHKICDLMEGSGELNYIRFNIFSDILQEHRHLMLGSDDVCGIHVQRTIQWSQRPHIARKDWYLETLNLYIKPNEKVMIEDALHGHITRRYKYKRQDEFKMAIYTPEGDQLRSHHTDGRGNDPKIIYG